MRSPRSSFHHLVVTCPGSRRSSSRPNAIAAWRTSVNVQRGSIRAYMWTPRPPAVFRDARVAALSQERARLGGHPHRAGEVRARLGVQVEPELVRMVDVV